MGDYKLTLKSDEMAEALAGLGVAANVIAFVDFGTEVFTTGYQLGKSARGSLEEHQTLKEESHI
ncbi:hypothetical protein WAI453_008650 [Rhynchosporium graminicola]